MEDFFVKQRQFCGKFLFLYELHTAVFGTVFGSGVVGNG